MSKFWDMDVEDVMGSRDDGNLYEGRTMPKDSDTPNPAYVPDVYYSRSHIAQLPLHEDSAEELVQRFSRVAGGKNQ